MADYMFEDDPAIAAAVDKAVQDIRKRHAQYCQLSKTLDLQVQSLQRESVSTQGALAAAKAELSKVRTELETFKNESAKALRTAQKTAQDEIARVRRENAMLTSKMEAMEGNPEVRAAKIARLKAGQAQVAAELAKLEASRGE